MLAAEKHKGTFLAPIGIGLALFVAELGAVMFTGGSLNPARSFGPDVVLGKFDNYHCKKILKITFVSPAKLVQGSTGSVLALGPSLRSCSIDSSKCSNSRPPTRERTRTIIHSNTKRNLQEGTARVLLSDDVGRDERTGNCVTLRCLTTRRTNTVFLGCILFSGNVALWSESVDQPRLPLLLSNSFARLA